MKYHKVTDEIQEILRAKDITFKIFEHEEVRTSEEAAALRPEYSLGQGAKALIIRYRPRVARSDLDQSGAQFCMFVMPADLKLDGPKVKEILNSKKFSFASEEEVGEITGGVKPGGVPPFGRHFGLTTYVDPKLLEHEEIIFNAGDKAFSLAMSSADYKDVYPIEVVDITS